MSSEHIIKRYDQELHSLASSVAKMGGLAEEQLAMAIEAVERRDTELASRVVTGDDKVDALEHDIDALVMRILALRQPVANDLREIVSARRIAAELERIADYAANVAKRTIALDPVNALPPTQTMRRMAAVVRAMMKSVLDAYVAREHDKAVAAWERDKEVDSLHNTMFRELLTYMMEDPRSITSCTHLLFMAKNIERIGDHITNIAEMVYYAVRGERLERIRPKQDATSLITGPSGDRAR